MKNKIVIIEDANTVINITDVLKWCNANPGEKLDHTLFFPVEPFSSYDYFMASDIEENKISSVIDLQPLGTWAKDYGVACWEILVSEESGLYFCHNYKTNRLLSITTD